MLVGYGASSVADLGEVEVEDRVAAPYAVAGEQPPRRRRPDGGSGPRSPCGRTRRRAASGRRGSGRSRAPGGSGRTCVALTYAASQPSSVRTRCGSQTPTERQPGRRQRQRPGVEDVPAGEQVGVVSARVAATVAPRCAGVEVAPRAGRQQPAVAVAQQVAGVVAVHPGPVGAPEEDVAAGGSASGRRVELPHRGVGGVEEARPALVAVSSTRPPGGVACRRRGSPAGGRAARAGRTPRSSPPSAASAGQPGLVVGVEPVAQVDEPAHDPAAGLAGRRPRAGCRSGVSATRSTGASGRP